MRKQKQQAEEKKKQAASKEQLESKKQQPPPPPPSVSSSSVSSPSSPSAELSAPPAKPLTKGLVEVGGKIKVDINNEREIISDDGNTYKVILPEGPVEVVLTK